MWSNNTVWLHFFQWQDLKFAKSPLGCWGWTRTSLRILQPLLLCSSFPWKPDFWDMLSQGCRKGCETAAKSPGDPTLWGNCKLCDAKLSRNLKKKRILSGKQRNNSLQVGNTCIDVWFLAAQTYFGASFSLSSTAGCLYRLLAVYIRSIHRMGCLYQTSNKFHSTVCVYHCCSFVCAELERNKTSALEINKQQTLLCMEYSLLPEKWPAPQLFNGLFKNTQHRELARHNMNGKWWGRAEKKAKGPSWCLSPSTGDTEDPFVSTSWPLFQLPTQVCSVLHSGCSRFQLQ